MATRHKLIHENSIELTSKLPTASFVPAGANTQIQFNNSGAFGASANLTWDGTTFAIVGNQTIVDTTSAGSGSLAGNALSIAQTWNTSGTPTAIKLNVTDTASNASSLLMDLQVGGTSKFKVTKGANMTLNSTLDASLITFQSTGDTRFTILNNSGLLSFSGVGTAGLGMAFDIPITTDTRNDGSYYNFKSTFAPTSGSIVNNTVRIAPTVNQTGGANGITRGLYINPTLTAASDFRALQMDMPIVNSKKWVRLLSGSTEVITLGTGSNSGHGNIGSGFRLYLTGSTDGVYIPSIGLYITPASVVSTSVLGITGAWFTGGTSTTTKPHVLIEPTGTTSTAWSTAGTGIGINAASGFVGNLIDLQLNGVNRFTVTSTGAVNTPGGVVAGGTIQTTGGSFRVADTQNIFWNTRTALSSAADGNLMIANNAQNSFGLLQFGGTTSSFPALKRSTTELQVRLADDSGYAPIQASSAIFNGSVFTTGQVQISGNFRLASVGTDGVGTLLGAGGVGWDRLQFGGTTSSFPALRRNGATLEVKLADNSADTSITAANVTASGNIIASGATSVIRLKGYTVSTLPGAPTVGDTAYVTDLLAPTFFTTAVGGGAIVGPVFFDGATWICT